MTIGEKIRAVRKKNYLTQKEFSEKMAVTNSHISQLEKDKIKPSGMFLKLLCLEYGISESFFTCDDADLPEIHDTSTIMPDANVVDKKPGLKETVRIKKPLSINLDDTTDIYNLDRAKLMKMVASYGSCEREILFISDQTEKLSLDLENFLYEKCSLDLKNWLHADAFYTELWQLVLSAGEDGFIAGFKMAFSMFCTVHQDTVDLSNFNG